jgi:TatD-related deoxyribonuclease
MADDTGLPRWRVVKHYCPPVVDEKENHGIFPSVLAGRDNIKSMLRTSTRFLLETDYMDWLERPDAVMAPQTVPRNMKRLLAAGAITEEQIFKINKENPEKVYGIEIK